ncbi:MAG TPA: hypothetical protein VN823_27050 [Stellaceae bacterium]|nr:hypothetical protein [Stellaceae bacterium]
MALPAQFSLLDSEFNEFLFATVGEERIGMPLSVVSAFTRLGLDPWIEAARLSDLPRDFAIVTLSGMIARLPVGRWEPSETRGIAARLVEFLPERGSVAGSDPAKAGAARRVRSPAVWLILAILGVAVFLGVAATSELPWVSSHASRSIPGAHPSE